MVRFGETVLAFRDPALGTLGSAARLPKHEGDEVVLQL